MRFFQCRINGLEILSIILDVLVDSGAEERVKFHVDIIYETLIRLLYDLNVTERVFEISAGMFIILYLTVCIVDLTFEIF